MKSVIDRNYTRAKKILNDNMDILHAMAEALIKYETIDAEQVDELMDRKSVTPPEDWVENGNSEEAAEKPAAAKPKKVATKKPVATKTATAKKAPTKKPAAKPKATDKRKTTKKKDDSDN